MAMDAAPSGPASTIGDGDGDGEEEPVSEMGASGDEAVSSDDDGDAGTDAE